MVIPGLIKPPLFIILFLSALLCSPVAMSAMAAGQGFPRTVDYQLQTELIGHLDQLGLNRAVR